MVVEIPGVFMDCSVDPLVLTAQKQSRTQRTEAGAYVFMYPSIS